MQQGSPHAGASVVAGAQRSRPASMFTAPGPILCLAMALPLACRPPAASDGGPVLGAESPHVVEVTASASAAPA